MVHKWCPAYSWQFGAKMITIQKEKKKEKERRQIINAMYGLKNYNHMN